MAVDIEKERSDTLLGGYSPERERYLVALDELEAAREKIAELHSVLRDVNSYYGGDTHSGVAKRVKKALQGLGDGG